MAKHYPLRFTLEDGAHVEVNQVSDNKYDFLIRKKQGLDEHFTLLDDDRPKDQIIEALDFDQLNAVRKFWLERDHII